MQKIQSYLYPNRIHLLADLAGFTTEYTNVYQRTVKIYNGIDNTLEFDIQNAQQKRIDLGTLSTIELNVMDAAGNELPNSPYAITPLNQTTKKGLATVVIPQEDLTELSDQNLRFSVTAVKAGADVILYSDSRFGATGTIELIGNAMPTFRDPVVYTDFTAEIDLNGNPIYHGSAIPTTFYEAVPTTNLSVDIQVSGFVGSIWIDATTADTISVESWRAAGKPFGSWVQTTEDGLFNGTIPFGSNLEIGKYKYFRVSYKTPTISGQAASFNVIRAAGAYTVTINEGGTGYGANSLIKIAGSQVGGVDGVNDIILTVTALEGGFSSYTVSAIVGITWTGTAAIGSGTYLVSGTNYSGTIDSVTVS
jgi:hypothetical protein